jgi:hypothetical protein
MIYTIGHAESYERYFREQGNPSKLGREKDYDGGSVWKTFEDAKPYATEGYSVYGVLANWDTDTVPTEADGDWHDLLVTSPLVRLTTEGFPRE